MGAAGELIAGRFELEELAGRGGMGEVYRALDRWTGAHVALKRMLPGAELDDARFAREAELLRAVDHPAIVRYVAHGTTDEGARYLAMEWLRGESLGDALDRAQRLSVADCVALGRRVAGALAAAHARGVIHRDIKPGNVFLVEGDVRRAVVLDFGIARSVAARGVTLTGALVGTPGYMAPEQVRGERGIDARADVFALGALLFAALTGSGPFEGAHAIAVLAKVLLEDPPRVAELRPEVPAWLDTLVARTLAKSADERPRDGAALLAALESDGRDPGATLEAPAAVAITDAGAQGVTAGRAAAITQGEQRLLCVVLADDGSNPAYSQASDTLTPEAAAARLLRARSLAGEFGGQVEDLAGGAVVIALRGAGVALDQVARAARCALALRQNHYGAIVLATGRGVWTGRVPLGDVIDRAAAMLPLARASSGDGIWTDAASAGLLDARFDVEAGANPDARLLRGERASPPEEGRNLLGRPTPCVGRERELGTLAALYDECVADSVARAVLVTAPAGMGKSRLRQEFVRKVRAREDPPEVWFAAADELSRGSPFALLARALRRAAGLLEGSGSAAATASSFEAWVAARVPAADATRVAAFLGEAIGVHLDDGALAPLRVARRDPAVMGDQIARAWEDLLHAVCGRHPLLVVLEDVHWGDVPSVSLIEAGLRHARALPWMVVAFARPDVLEVFPRLWAEQGAHEVRVGELSRRAAERLVRAVLGDATPGATVERIVDRAGGNAFYLEELIRAVDAGHADALPATLLAVSQAGIEALEPEARRVLRAASVFGEACWTGGLDAVLGRGADAARWVRELCRRELLERRRASRFPGEDEYAFRHALARDAAYATLTDADRALGHRLAAAWLEQAGERDPVLLAEHYDRGAERARAAECYVRGAAHALEGNDLDAVLLRSARAVALGAEGDALGHAHALAAQGHFWRSAAAPAVRSAWLAHPLLRPGSLAWCRNLSALVLMSGYLGDSESAMQCIRALYGITPEPDARAAYLQACATMILLCAIAGLPPVARMLGARVEEIDAAFGDDPVVHASAAVGRIWLAKYVDPAPMAHLRHARAMLEISAREGDVRAAAVAQTEVAAALFALGAHDEAERVARDALGPARKSGVHLVIGTALQWLACTLALRGAYDEAHAAIDEAIATFERMGAAMRTQSLRVTRAHVAHQAGDYERAAREASAAAEGLAANVILRSTALATAAEAHLRADRAADALAAARAAYAIVERVGTIGHSDARVRHALAAALCAAGSTDEARAFARDAAARIRALAAAIDDEGRAASFLAAVPENVATLAFAAALDAR